MYCVFLMVVMVIGQQVHSVKWLNSKDTDDAAVCVCVCLCVCESKREGQSLCVCYSNGQS